MKVFLIDCDDAKRFGEWRRVGDYNFPNVEDGVNNGVVDEHTDDMGFENLLALLA